MSFLVGRASTSPLTYVVIPKGKALYNAMRTSKRVLAGIAAGALGAGVLAFVAAPAAQAGVGASVAFDYPSATIVAAASDFDGVPVPISVYDTPGDEADGMTGHAVGLGSHVPGPT